MLNFRLVTPPAAEPISIDQAKKHLRVDFAEDDLLIELIISAAREVCEQKTGRSIFNQTFCLSLDQFNYGDWRSTIPMERRNPLRFSALWESMALRLPRPRLVSVTSITYLDVNGETETLDPGAYVADADSEPARIVPAINLTWPTTDYYIPGSVKVTYVSGSYGDGKDSDTCPASIKQAMLLIIGHLYINREETAEANLKSIPLGVDALLNPYRFYGWM